MRANSTAAPLCADSATSLDSWLADVLSSPQSAKLRCEADLERSGGIDFAEQPLFAVDPRVMAKVDAVLSRCRIVRPQPGSEFSFDAMLSRIG